MSAIPRCAPQLLCLYGWDSRTETWHGPNELSAGIAPDRRLLGALRNAPGKSWYGTVSCADRGSRFFAMVHDLDDCGMAAIYCDESKVGPAEIVAVLPGHRRARLRDEFAFEFLAFARFLGAVGPGAELQVHEGIGAALAEHGDSTIVISISSGMWPGDLDAVLSRCVEKVAVTVGEWLNV